ncbi:unnamed protein product [Closterium sp. NIES-54]
MEEARGGGCKAGGSEGSEEERGGRGEEEEGGGGEAEEGVERADEEEDEERAGGDESEDGASAGVDPTQSGEIVGGIHLEADGTTQEFKLFHGKGGLYISKAALKNNVFVLDFVPDQGTADSDAIVNFTSWTHPPDLDPDFKNTMRKLLRGMRLPNHQWPEAMDHAVMLHNLLSSSSLPNNASPHLLWTGKPGNTKMLRDFGCMETVAARDVIFYERLILQTYLDNLAANRDLTGGFRGNRAFASTADEADWDKQNVDGASEETGPLPYCSVDIPTDDDNPRESINAENYFDFGDTDYVTPQPVDTNVSERIRPNFCENKRTGVNELAVK